MALASLSDINVHLPEDKLEVVPAQYSDVQLDAERVVRGYLSGYIDPVVLAGWSNPTVTPEIIRAVVGRLCAAFWYRKRYSEDSLVDPQFALIKYNEAISMLQMIQAGTLKVDSIVVTSGIDLENVDYWPNDTTPGPYFTMDMNP
jgi:hypothetical protein